MGIVIYTYQSTPSEIDRLRGRFGKSAMLCQEMVPPPQGVRVHLINLVGETLKKPSTVVVANFKELGDNAIEVSKNAQKILQRNHTLLVESKQAEFKTPEEFETYFAEFLELMPRASVEVKRGKGRPTKMTAEMVDAALGLKKRGVSYRDIEESLRGSGDFDPEEVPSFKTIRDHLLPLLPSDDGE